MPQQPPPDPQEVQSTIDYLDGLADQPFAEALADNIMDPSDDEERRAVQAAFRSEKLAFRSLVAARYLVQHANTTIRYQQSDSRADKARRTQHFINRVGMERRILQAVVDGIRARDGRLPNAPNPRRRAMDRLVTENLRGDVPKGRFNDLVAEEEAIAAARRRREKEERKEARRQAKLAARRG